MKTLIRICFFLFLIISSKSSYSQTNTFIDSISGLANITITNLVSTTDSGFLIAGEDGFPDWENNFYVQKNNKSGNKVWVKTYDAGYEDKIISMTSTSDKGFVVLANIYNGKKYDLNSVLILIMKCDSLGNITWEKELFSKSTKSLSAGLIIQTKDNGYYLACCTTPNFVGTTNELVLIKLDSNGNTLWTKFHQLNYSVYGISGLAEGAKNALILSISGGDCSQYCEKSFLYEFDRTGNFKWGIRNYFKSNIESLSDLQTYGIVSDNKGIHVLSKVLDDGRNFYCYQLLGDDGVGKSKASWLDFNIFSLKNFLLKNSINAFQNYSLPQQGTTFKYLLQSGGSAVSAEYSFAFTYGYVKIYGYDNRNRICPDYQKQVFSDSVILNEDSLPDVFLQPVADRLLVLNPNVAFANSQHDFFQLCQSAGYSLQARQKINTAVAESKQPDILKIFPNPASNILHVEVNKNAELRLYNSLGIQVKDINVSYDASINISDIEPGLYFLKNLNTGQVVKIIIR